jgi:hypothetical protein
VPNNFAIDTRMSSITRLVKPAAGLNALYVWLTRKLILFIEKIKKIKKNATPRGMENCN